MNEVSVRELRNHGGEVLDRVIRGEHLTITRDGRPVAELRRVERPALPLEVLMGRWSKLAPVDPDAVRRDLDRVIEPGL